MNRYRVIREIGGGAFGTVFEAEDTTNGQVVAIKQIKQALRTWKECVGLREVASLTKIPKHPHVVRLRQLIFEGSILNFVFEYLPRDLLTLMKAHRGPVSEEAVRRIMWQLLHGLHHMHRHGFFHRDLKPENLLCVGESIETADIKICDLGQAREVRSRPPYTEYVSTRWYRAPEVLLRSRYYNSPVDMWAAGVTMAELFAGRPAFPGTSEVNQLYLLLEALGPPSHEYWADGVRQMKALHLTMPRTTGAKGLSSLCPRASGPALQLLGELLQLNPARRATAASALASDWFAGMPPVVVPAAAAGEDEGIGSASAGGPHALSAISASASASATSTASHVPSMGSYRSGGHALAHAGSTSLRGDGTGVSRGVSDGQVLSHASRRPPVSDRSRAAHSTNEGVVTAATQIGMDMRGHGRSSSVPHTRPRAGHPSIGASAASVLSGVPEVTASMESAVAGMGVSRGGTASGAAINMSGGADMTLTTTASASAAGRSYHMHSPKAGALSTASGFAGPGRTLTTPGSSAGAATLPPRLATDTFTAGGDSSASLIAMARELGVGVSPLPNPGRSGDVSASGHATSRGFGSESGGGGGSVGVVGSIGARGAGAGSGSLYSGGDAGLTSVSLTGAMADSRFDASGSTGALSSAAQADTGTSWTTSGSGVLGGGPLSPVQRGDQNEDDNQQISLDTDQLEALLGSLGQGTVV